MVKTTVERYCDLCGENYEDCNKDDRGCYKDSGKIDISFDHFQYSTQDTFYDSDLGSFSTKPIHLDVCSKCFAKLRYALEKPEERLSLQDIPENYRDGYYYDEISKEEFDKIPHGSLKDAGYSSHDACSYKSCPKCGDTFGWGLDNHITKMYTKIGNHREFFNLFTCPKCNYKMRILY